jgi:hypothetical protein
MAFSGVVSRSYLHDPLSPICEDSIFAYDFVDILFDESHTVLVTFIYLITGKYEYLMMFLYDVTSVHFHVLSTLL